MSLALDTSNTTETGHADDMQFLPTHWKLDVI
jgi:hypothetical protein